MEAVPRLPMLCFELKVSPDNTEFGPKLKHYIRDHYNEDPDAYSAEVHELEGLRASAVRAPRDFTGCSTLKKYYCQLHFLQSRFPMGENQQSAASYSWCDLYSSSVYNTTDIKYEMACILYNIGALHTELGALDARNTPDGMKISCTHFQCAAWAFQHLRESYPQPRDSDLSPTLLTFVYNLSLAQAQECILEKSMTDNRKPTIIAKVATQVVEYLKSAHKTIDANKSQDVAPSEIVGSKLLKMWKKYCDFKMAYYSSVALLYQGMQAEEQQKMGERLAYYQAAMDKLSEANKLSKNLEKQDLLEESLNFTLDVLGGKFTAAQKENEFVYHEKVPPASSLVEVKGASLVKGIPFSVSDAEVSGGDIFSKLVPMEAHQASSMYSEEKAKLLRRIGAMIQEKNEELEMYLASMQLESLSLDADNDVIPQELIESCADLSTQNGIRILTDAMAKISNHYHDIDATLNEIQKILKDEEEKGKEFSTMMGKRAPNMILGELKREASKYCEAHKSVQENNTTLHKAIKHHMANLQLLSQPLDQVVAALPSTASVEASGDTAAKVEVQRLLGKVDEMRTQRQNFEGQLRANLQTDDVTKQLVTQQDEMEEFFKTELKKHEKIVGLLEQNMTAQGNILQALSEANAAYATTRRQTDQILAQRRSFIDSLLASYYAYKDILTKAQDAQDFYEKLEGQVNKLISRVKSVCRVQDEEREEMLSASVKKFTSGIPGAPAATVPCPTDQVSSSLSTSGPKLKDYLQHMKGGAKGIPGMPPVAAQGLGSYTSNMRPAPVGSEQTEVVPSCSTSQAAAAGYGSAYQTPTSAFPPSAPSPAPSPAPQGSPLKHGSQYYPQAMSLQHPSTEGAATSAPSSQYQYAENYPYYGYEYPAGVGAQPGTMPVSYPHASVSTAVSTLPQSPSLSHAAQSTTASSVAAVSSGAQNAYSAPYGYSGAAVPNNAAYQDPSSSATGTYQQPSYQSQSTYYAPQYSGVAATRVSSPVPKDSRLSDTNKYPSAYQYPDGIQGYVGQRNYPNISNPVYSHANIYSQGHNTFTSQANGSKGYGGPVTFQTASTSVTSTVQTGPSTQSQAGPKQADVASSHYGPGYAAHFNQACGSKYIPQISTGYSAPFAGKSNQMYGNMYGGQQEMAVVTTSVSTTLSPVTAARDNPYGGAPHNLSYSMAGGGSVSGAQTNVSQSPNQYYQGVQQKEHHSAPQHPQQQQPQDYSGYTAQYNWSQYGYPQSNAVTTQPAQGHQQSHSQQQYPQPLQGQGQQQYSQLQQTHGKQQYPQQQYPQPQQAQGQQQYPQPKQTQGQQQYPQPPQSQGQLQYQQPKQTQGQQQFQVQQQAQGQQYPQSHQVPQQQYSQPQQIQGQQYPQPQQASGQQIPKSQQTPQQHVQQPLPVAASTSTAAATPSPAGGISNLDLLSGIEMSAPTTQWSPLTPQPAGSSSVVAPTSTSGGPSSTPDLTSTASSKPNVAASGLPNVVSSVGEKKASVAPSSPAPVQPPEPQDATPAKPVVTSTILDLQAIKKSVPASTKPIATNPLSNDETLSKLASETERFSKMVEGLDRKSLNGPTNLELKWKEVTDALDRECAQYKVSVARCYPLKNRYADILPFDHTRVQLPSERDDYINASHVAIKNVSESFPVICTQAPLPSTFGDFWSLIWEQQAELVVCLNTEAELKGQLYWPNQRGSSLTFGALSISLQSYKDGSSWCQRVLQLTNHNTKITRVVIHMQFLAWPPSAMPENPAPLLQFMAEVHNFQRQQRNKNHPVVVQCISGIGRSGVFVVLSAFIKDIQTTGTLSDLQALVVDLCCQRRNGIQDKDHLYFLYKATLYHTQDILMKRGILTNKATFEEGPREKTHVRHPSADLLSTCDLSRLQVKLGLGTTNGEEDGQVLSKESKDVQQHSRSGSSASVHSSTSHSSTSADAGTDGVPHKTSQGPDVGTPPAKSFLKLETSQTLSPSLAASIDPQLFRIEITEPSKKTKITKEDFEQTKGAIGQSHEDPSDPFSTIDPLWSLKKA